MWIIYALFAFLVLYFPSAEFVGHLARETRFFKAPPVFPIEDALLPFLCLALFYSVIAGLSSRIERRSVTEKEDVQ
jgi:hypothetical protein